MEEMLSDFITVCSVGSKTEFEVGTVLCTEYAEIVELNLGWTFVGLLCIDVLTGAEINRCSVFVSK